MTRSSWCRLLTMAIIAALLSPACGKTVGEAIDDTTITTRVKTAMLNDPDVGGLRVDVDTYKGMVTLSGRVKSQAEHDRAIALARRVNGVAEVKDALQILPEGQPAPQK
jgi:osmotically-inducible protein OsmY